MANKKKRSVYPKLTVYSEDHFKGKRRTIRGYVAARNVERYLEVESLRFHSTNRNASLVMFSEKKFQGSYKVVRGHKNITDVDPDMKSFVMANFHVTNSQIRNLQRTQKLPRYFRIY